MRKKPPLQGLASALQGRTWDTLSSAVVPGPMIMTDDKWLELLPAFCEVQGKKYDDISGYRLYIAWIFKRICYTTEVETPAFSSKRQVMRLFRSCCAWGKTLVALDEEGVGEYPGILLDKLVTCNAHNSEVKLLEVVFWFTSTSFISHSNCIKQLYTLSENTAKAAHVVEPSSRKSYVLRLFLSLGLFSLFSSPT